MSSRASIKGHPLHPMLIALPIGLWTFSLFCDVMAFVTKDASWATASYRCIAGGLVTGLAAAVPGLIDFFGISERRTKAVAVAHMAFNLVVMAMYAADLAWRSSAGFGLGPVLLAAGALVFLTVSGWLGGELVYKHGMGVDMRDAGAAPQRVARR